MGARGFGLIGIRLELPGTHNSVDVSRARRGIVQLDRDATQP